MSGKWWRQGWLALSLAGLLQGAQGSEAPSVDDLMRRNADAHGGREAWCKVQSIAWSGFIDNPNMPNSHMAFELLQKRPNKARFEMSAMNQKTIRAFDGTAGWKVLPTVGGHPEIQEYRPEENQFMQDAGFLDAPLIDCGGAPVKAAVEGSEEVDGRPNWRISLVSAAGSSRRVWVDAETFLETRSEREVRAPSGATGRVSVRYGDYREFEGIKLPMVIEGGGGPKASGARMLIGKVEVDVPMADSLFARPQLRKHGTVVDARAPSEVGAGVAGVAAGPGAAGAGREPAGKTP